MDGLSRYGNLDHAFASSMKHGCRPDVVTYTVMITGYDVAGEFDEAQKILMRCLKRGSYPMYSPTTQVICGLCVVGKFEEACPMLKEMGSKGCKPNFLVYTTILSYLRNAKKMDEAQKVVERGDYVYPLGRIKRCRRC